MKNDEGEKESKQKTPPPKEEGTERREPQTEGERMRPKKCVGVPTRRKCQWL